MVVKVRRIINLKSIKNSAIVAAVPSIIEPGKVTGGPVERISEVSTLITRLQLIVSSVAFAVAVAMIVWGGVIYATAGGDEQRAARGKKIITYAAVGIFLIITATGLIYVLINLLGGTVTTT